MWGAALEGRGSVQIPSSGVRNSTAFLTAGTRPQAIFCIGRMQHDILDVSVYFSELLQALRTYCHCPCESSGRRRSAVHHIASSQFGAEVSGLAKPLQACLAPALICPLIFESLTLSKRGHLFPLTRSVFVPRRAARTISSICQETSMISMLPEKLDCLPILPSSSRLRVSEMPSSNSI